METNSSFHPKHVCGLTSLEVTVETLWHNRDPDQLSGSDGGPVCENVQDERRLGYLSFVFPCISKHDTNMSLLLISLPFVLPPSLLHQQCMCGLLCVAHLSMSFTRLCLRSLRSKIFMSRISMDLWISLSVRSRSSRELFRFCSEFWTRLSRSELRISISCGVAGERR